MSTGLRTLPLVLALTTCSTYAFATPAQSDLKRRSVVVRLDTPDFAKRSFELRLGEGARVRKVRAGKSDFGRTSRAVRPSTQATCYEIRSGDTAARLARRLTGNEFSRYQPWFQIVEPATGAFVPKSRYNLIQSGWHVCVATDMLRFKSIPAGYFPLSPALPVIPQTPVTQKGTAKDARLVWWSTPLVVLFAGLLLAWSWKHIDERQARRDLMRGFGTMFISEFERPLLRNATGRPLKSRLRFAPARRRMEILVAPGSGRTYPNLVDHKRNVEYDVERVMQILRHEPFISETLYAEGRWVVIPCRFEGGRQREGVL